MGFCWERTHGGAGAAGVLGREAKLSGAVPANLSIGYLVVFTSVSDPVANSTRKRFCRHTSQAVCPWNVSFASENREPAFAAHKGLDSTDARATARALLTMSVMEFQQQFRGSPMKRAKRRGLARIAAVVLGNVGTSDDVPLLEAALAHDQPLVREHAAWALMRLAGRSVHS